MLEVGAAGREMGVPAPAVTSCCCCPTSAQPWGVAVSGRPPAPQAFGTWSLHQPVPLLPAHCKQPPCRGQKPAMSCPCAGLGNPGGTWRPAPCLQGDGRGDRRAAACSQQGSELLRPNAVPWRALARADPAQRFHHKEDSEWKMKSGE